MLKKKNKIAIISILIFSSCVDENGNPIPVQFKTQDPGDCKVMEHFIKHGAYMTICHEREKTTYDFAIEERESEY